MCIQFRMTVGRARLEERLLPGRGGRHRIRYGVWVINMRMVIVGGAGVITCGSHGKRVCVLLGITGCAYKRAGKWQRVLRRRTVKEHCSQDS